MKFEQGILDYQAVDKELLALENEVTKSPERARLYTANGRVNAAAEGIGKLGAEAVELVSGFDKLKERLDAIVEKLNDFDGIAEGAEDVSEADHYLKMLDSLIAEISALEKDASRDSNRTDGISSDFKRLWTIGTNANEEYKKAKVEYDAYIAERQPKINELTAKLNELKKAVSPEIIAVYLRLRAAKKNPAFIQYDASVGACKGCGLELSSAARGKLKSSGDATECPNCGRILFVL